MKKIGITTLHNYNYGSALQAYALQKFLEQKFNIQSVLINKRKHSGIFGKLFLILHLFGFCLFHPLSTKTILNKIKKSRSKELTISQESLKQIDTFNKVSLTNDYFSKKDLKRIGINDEWLFFISGSDQIWNGENVDDYFLSFLRFAPKAKRIAYAPSFGSDRVASYNIKRYKRYISEYNVLSVRESSGKDIVEKYGVNNIEIMPDPVFLLSKKEWEHTCSLSEREKKIGKYILVFFIDRISSSAIDFIKTIHSDIEFIVFGYKHPELDGLVKYSFFDGGPFDFLALIRNSTLVLTDSFHCLSFSIIFNKSFFVFDRSYRTNQNQSTRIINILKTNNLIEAYNPSRFEIIPTYDFNDYLDVSYSKGLDFFKKIFKNFNYFSEKKNVSLVSKQKCYKCRLCEEICNFNAVGFEKCGDGHSYPKITEQSCVGCTLCYNRCPVNIEIDETQIKKAFCGYSKDIDGARLSSSGGIFYQIASEFIDAGGFVCGAQLTFDDGIINCSHKIINRKEDLRLLQGSKYVQSNILGILPQIKELLNKNNLVLFSGTSCQVAALKSFLGKAYENLFTIDLICHGVLENHVLQDYVDYLNSKFKFSIKSISFRKQKNDGREPYQLEIQGLKNNIIITKVINFYKSVYLRMFLASGGLRESCYHCKYASLKKVGDITLGDYLDKDEFYNNALGQNENGVKLSSIIVNNAKGLSLLQSSNLKLIEVPYLYMSNIHSQLKEPSKLSKYGQKLYSIYRKKGFNAAQKELSLHNLIMFFPSKIKHLLNRTHG